jgi:uncharacterized HAD superfamily protein
MGKTIVIDMDGTICEECNTFDKYCAKPLPGVIQDINKLYEEGNTIIIHTARAWPMFKMTKDWLDKYGIHYHSLICGKPQADYIIDDRSFPSIHAFMKGIYDG